MFKTASLTPEAFAVLQRKATEAPFSGVFDNFGEPGSYLCRQCGLALFRATHKFASGCGWPSFDEEITNAVAYQADGMRTEILCARCRGHLGHVFRGENFTVKNTRHCVNSLSLDYVTDKQVVDTQEAIFAAGCFWGVEYLFQQLQGVVKTEVGYSGGHKSYPSYQEVCAANTGHLESIRILFDPSVISYEQLVKYFFEIHDQSQANGQGPDIGPQYLSAIFYFDERQKQTAEVKIKELESLGYKVATQVLPVSTFWAAEDYHQNYYAKNKKTPYCHFYTKKF